MHPYREYVNPYLGKLLNDIKMDKSYVKGEGCLLYDAQGNEYLDCIAAYGALPFGYNYPEIWECIDEVHTSMEPSFIQPSALNAAGELAQKLIKNAPGNLRYVTFTNSGAETVEAAIKLCRSATNRLGILSTYNSFHGKTLGALSATGKNTYQQKFGAPVKGFKYVEYGNLEAIEKEFKSNADYYAAFIVEPIQGEGGIVQPPYGYLEGVKKLCKKYGVFLIFDEIQTGLGRTGKLFACEHEQVSPDVLLIAKAIGGGIMPIGACLCTEQVYNEEFANKHSSTFAANTLACRVGLKVLDILLRDDRKLIKEVQQKGMIFKKGLLDLKQKYPNIIKSIRGQGLMLGIEFGITRDFFPQSLIAIMAEQELLTPMISSYLLNVEKIRVAPTLNGADVIRIEPPLIIEEKQISKALNGLDNMMKVLNRKNTGEFLSFLVNDIQNQQTSHIIEYKQKTVQKKVNIKIPQQDEGRFAFIVHPLDLKNYLDFDESLSIYSESQLRELTQIWSDVARPFVIGKTNIVSKCGSKAYGEFIVIPKTAEQLIKQPKDKVLDELKDALKLAKDRGAKIVGLGAYTSVVSMGGLYLKDQGIPITTGNGYTVVSAVEAVTAALDKLGECPTDCVAAVVGATGSIGKGISILIAENVSKLILIGNPRNIRSSCARLYRVAAEVVRHIAFLLYQNKTFKKGSIGYKLSKCKHFPTFDKPLEYFIDFVKKCDIDKNPVLISTSIDEVLPYADVVMSATSSISKLITPSNLKKGAVVCDISRPANVSKEVEKSRPDVLVIDGGVIQLPGNPDLGWNFGFEQGQAYACMSETIMLALEKHYKNTSIGASGLTLDNILYMRNLAQKHGFKLAKFRSFDRPLSDKKWEMVVQARKQLKINSKKDVL